jgi:hypothetical protein
MRYSGSEVPAVGSDRKCRPGESQAKAGTTTDDRQNFEAATLAKSPIPRRTSIAPVSPVTISFYQPGHPSRHAARSLLRAIAYRARRPPRKAPTVGNIASAACPDCPITPFATVSRALRWLL